MALMVASRRLTAGYLVRERRTAAKARSAQGAAQFAAGHAAARLATHGAQRVNYRLSIV